MTFEQLGISSELVKGLAMTGIKTPTKIQEEAIPAACKGRDIIGMSKTGSGKTAAFGIPILNIVKPGKGLQAVVLAPTRELAVQIAEELTKWSRYRRTSIATIYGGVGFGPQVDALRHADIMVGTPGRVLDHLNRNTLRLDTVTLFALDEADKMVEMGFIRDVQEILEHTKENRQILLFGATLSSEIKGIQQRFMHDPLTVKGEEHVAEDFLEQYYYNVDRNEKFSMLVHLLHKGDTDKVIVFCSTRANVDLVTANLKRQGIRAEMIHGKLTQSRRLQVVDRFKNGTTQVLVGSAVAARGLDIRGISHVINYDLSNDPQEYVHRVGRTARAGASGKAITLLSQRDHGAFNEILYRFRLKVNELPREEFKRLRFDAQQQQRRHHNGRNPRFDRVKKRV